jgi:hypothetical protein
MYILIDIDIYTEYETNGKQKQQQTETRKQMFVFLGRQMITVIGICCFSKRAHL